VKDNVFIVVLYNKTCSESSTLKKLMKLPLGSETLCVIWNNGPKSIQAEFEGFFSKESVECHLFETIDNISLAKIYNSVFRNFKSKRYIVLDDDSEISYQYYNALQSISENEVGMPIIYSNEVVVNPRINNKEYIFKQVINDNDIIITIGSGLVIGKNVVSLLREKFADVFDERFKLYGVDTSFCYRLNKINGAFIKIIPGFEHSLSRLNKSSDTLKSFRIEERSNDVALQIRYYFSKREWIPMLSKIVLSSIKKLLTNKSQQYNIITIFKVFIKGKHERQ